MKADPPPVALVGETEVRVGTGFLIAKAKALEMPVSGLRTVTEAVFPAATSEAPMSAWSSVPLMKVVCRSLPVPSHRGAVHKTGPERGEDETPDYRRRPPREGET